MKFLMNHSFRFHRLHFFSVSVKSDPGSSIIDTIIRSIKQNGKNLFPAVIRIAILFHGISFAGYYSLDRKNRHGNKSNRFPACQIS